VCIEDRVDPDKQRGRVDPKLRCKGEYAGDLRKVPCHYEDEEHIAADQIFPHIKTEFWYTPTIKHHCPRTALASSLRACSNKVFYDPKVFKEYSNWFRKFYIPKFKRCLDEELWEVDLEKWLQKYPKSYRDNIRKSLDPDHINTKVSCKYEAFTKVELQFTTVPHDLKETELNDVKERQICGPDAEKKACANAFINLLEEVASKYFKPYCGRANWVKICADLEEIETQLKSFIWGASDGSGFDMTQYPEMNRLMNELIMACAYHPNVHFNEPLTILRLQEVLDGSLDLDVSVDHGALQYHAVGRASGDGWTTFGNSMLMISYWMFTFYKAGIKDYGLKVKGDDVLFCVQKVDLPKLKLAVKYVFTDKKELHCHGLGQICKKIDYGELTDLDFLSNEFFLTKEGHYRMTRIPARVIQTNSWSTKVPKTYDLEKAKQELCYSKGKCLKAWADGLPIFGVLADKMIELGKPGRLSNYDEYADGDRTWHQGRDDREAYLFYLEQRYGLTSSEVVSAEVQINQVTNLKGVLELPMLEKLYHRI
jgi:hypothetical protein